MSVDGYICENVVYWICFFLVHQKCKQNGICATLNFLLVYFCRHRPNEVELLFDLLRVFTHRHIPDFQFLKTFMKDDVAKVFILNINDQNFRKLFFIFLPCFLAVAKATWPLLYANFKFSSKIRDISKCRAEVTTYSCRLICVANVCFRFYFKFRNKLHN